MGKRRGAICFWAVRPVIGAPGLIRPTIAEGGAASSVSGPLGTILESPKPVWPLPPRLSPAALISTRSLAAWPANSSPRYVIRSNGNGPPSLDWAARGRGGPRIIRRRWRPEWPNSSPAREPPVATNAPNEDGKSGRRRVNLRGAPPPA